MNSAKITLAKSEIVEGYGPNRTFSSRITLYAWNGISRQPNATARNVTPRSESAAGSGPVSGAESSGKCEDGNRSGMDMARNSGSARSFPSGPHRSVRAVNDPSDGRSANRSATGTTVIALPVADRLADGLHQTGRSRPGRSARKTIKKPRFLVVEETGPFLSPCRLREAAQF